MISEGEKKLLYSGVLMKIPLSTWLRVKKFCATGLIFQLFLFCNIKTIWIGGGLRLQI